LQVQIKDKSIDKDLTLCEGILIAFTTMITKLVANLSVALNGRTQVDSSREA